MKLKNYHKYLNILLDYAKLCKVTIWTKSLKNEYTGEFVPSGRFINLSDDLDDSEEIATILHELGHFYDQQADEDFNNNFQLNRAYNRMHRLGDKATFTKKEKQMILECEARAWNHGRVIAKKFKIPLGSWYDAEELAGLSEYQSLKIRPPK